jgi:lysozyme family protein
MANFSKWWAFCMNPNRDGLANDGTTDGAGMTRWGWTFPTWEAAMDFTGQSSRATTTNFATMTKGQAGNLAEAYFWVRCCGPLMPSGSDVMVIDWHWNSGEAGVMEIQSGLGFTHGNVDGIIGPATVRAITAMGQTTFIDNCHKWRVNFLNAHGYQKRFPGLYTRSADCRTLAISLI